VIISLEPTQLASCVAKTQDVLSSLNWPVESGLVGLCVYGLDSNAGSGAILAMVQAASHRTPDIICGKPYKPMIDVIVNKYNIDPKKTLMIGDR